MDIILNIGLDTLTNGLAYAILALGVFISFRVLNFADMTTEGTYVLGMSSSVLFIAAGVPAVIATVLSIFVGMIAGFITGILHTKLHINGLLAGIITMTGLFTINMILLGIANSCVTNQEFSFLYGLTSNVSLTNSGYRGIFHIFRGFYESNVDFSNVLKYWIIGISFVITLIVFVSMYFFFGTEVGMSMRAVGMNPKMARAQGINSDFYIILGLMLSNGLIALSASLKAQSINSGSTLFGPGMLVVGLACIIIGEAIFGKRSFLNWIISVALGSLVYYLIISIALELGLPSDYLKLLYALIMVLILTLSFVNSKTHFFDKLKRKLSKRRISEEEILAAEAHEDIKESDIPLVVEDEWC